MVKLYPVDPAYARPNPSIPSSPFYFYISHAVYCIPRNMAALISSFFADFLKQNPEVDSYTTRIVQYPIAFPYIMQHVTGHQVDIPGTEYESMYLLALELHICTLLKPTLSRMKMYGFDCLMRFYLKEALLFDAGPEIQYLFQSKQLFEYKLPPMFIPEITRRMDPKAIYDFIMFQEECSYFFLVPLLDLPIRQCQTVLAGLRAAHLEHTPKFGALKKLLSMSRNPSLTIDQLIPENDAQRDVLAKLIFNQGSATKKRYLMAPDSSLPYGYSILELAIATGFNTLLQYLLQQPLQNMNADLQNGISPLELALQMNNLEAVSLLLDHENVNVNAQDSKGDSQLHIACRYCNKAYLELLLARPEIDINIQAKNGNTPLHVAYLNGFSDGFSMLLAQEIINPNIANNMGYTVMHYMCEDDNAEALKTLLASEYLELHSFTFDGFAPLSIAAMNDSFACLQLLCERSDIDINLCDPHGYTARDYAVRSGSSQSKLLLEHDPRYSPSLH